MQPVIRVEGLSKRYKLGLTHAGSVRELVNGAVSRLRKRQSAANSEDRDAGHLWALRDVSFDVQAGEVLGIIGRNGAGKSTLLRILSRITTPTSGRAELRGRVASLLEVGTGFHPELTGRENVYMNGAILGMTRREIDRKFESIIDFAGVESFVDTPVKRYSSGMKVRLGFAVAAHMSPEILIIDEVLAVGDAEFQGRCVGKLGDVARSGRTVLFVSHNMSAVKALCKRVILVDSGKYIRDGSPTEVVDEYLSNALTKPVGVPEDFLYFKDPSTISDEFGISGIQLLNSKGEFVNLIGTWSKASVRIHYVARTFVKFGAVELLIRTPEGVPLIRCSTRPESDFPLQLEVGEGYIDCVFEKWPLTEGKYILDAGLARPRVEYLCWHEGLCELEVSGRDVFYSGKPPSSSRYLVATNHQWRHGPG